MARILYLYNATQTFTDTVFQHIASFGKYSCHATYYVHQDPSSTFTVDLSMFDAVCIHYSIRLPFDQLSCSTVEALRRFDKLKLLFIQDEYDHTQRAWHWIHALGIRLVFTVVPEKNIENVYPREQLSRTRFCSVLTGYVPENLPCSSTLPPPSERALVVGYRGRPLPVRYGKLGFEKVEIGRMVKTYCKTHGFSADIAWTEEARIYGTKWLGFLASCRSMLGSESGSNVFDFDGSLISRLQKFKEVHPQAGDAEIYRNFIEPEERDGLMNQISPRVFEAISLRTVLVLFEGHYSGILQAGTHYIQLKKDGSNLREVFSQLLNESVVNHIADRAYRDIIKVGNYSYRSFVEIVDREIDRQLAEWIGNSESQAPLTIENPPITKEPIRAAPPLTAGSLRQATASPLWKRLSLPLRRVLRP